MLSILRIFESLCFRHIREQLSRKLGDRNQYMIIIDYHPSRAYKLFSPNENMIIIISKICNSMEVKVGTSIKLQTYQCRMVKTEITLEMCYKKIN